tara:strand:+ start:2096 stop:2611 length:516 start_codon:yes stop_codon:yes gene_type:complete
LTYKGAPMMSVRQDWGTPQAFFDYVEEYFSVTFTLDACASNYNFKVSRYYSEKDNALEQEPISETIWMNPPFGHGGKLQRTFIEKASLWSIHNSVFCLIPSRTDTRLFHDVIVPNARAIYFIKGRLNFEGPNREGCNNSTFPSMLVQFEPSIKNGEPFFYTLEPTPKERGF